MWDGAAIQQIDTNARSTRNPQSEYQQRAQQQYYEQQRYYQEQQAAQMPPLPAAAYDGPAGAPPPSYYQQGIVPGHDGGSLYADYSRQPGPPPPVDLPEGLVAVAHP